MTVVYTNSLKLYAYMYYVYQYEPVHIHARSKGSRARGVQSTEQERPVLSNSDFEQSLRALRWLHSMREELFRALW